MKYTLISIPSSMSPLFFKMEVIGRSGWLLLKCVIYICLYTHVDLFKYVYCIPLYIFQIRVYPLVRCPAPTHPLMKACMASETLNLLETKYSLKIIQLDFLYNRKLSSNQPTRYLFIYQITYCILHHHSESGSDPIVIYFVGSGSIKQLSWSSFGYRIWHSLML